MIALVPLAVTATATAAFANSLPTTGMTSTTRGSSPAVSVYVAGTKMTTISSPGTDAAYFVDPCRDTMLGFFEQIAWPLVTFILVALLIWSGSLNRFAAFIRSIKAGGIEIEFSSEGANRARSTIVETYREFNRAARNAYEQAVRTYSIRENFKVAIDVIRESMQPHDRWPIHDYRATIHVPDVVIDDYLYQLVDYLPSGPGSGRRFSVRRGIIGRCWRLGCSLGTGDALAPPRGPVAAAQGHTSDDTALVQEWGMTWEEAEKWRKDKRHSFLCILLRTASASTAPSPPVGILYIDSIAKDAFGSDDEAANFAKMLESNAAMRNLAIRIAEALESLKKGGTFINFTSND